MSEPAPPPDTGQRLMLYVDADVLASLLHRMEKLLSDIRSAQTYAARRRELREEIIGYRKGIAIAIQRLAVQNLKQQAAEAEPSGNLAADTGTQGPGEAREEAHPDGEQHVDGEVG